MKQRIFAHRGAAGDYPENTMLSYQKALEAGADGLEIDVQLTSDQQVVVVHDETMERLFGQEKAIKDCTLAELQQLSFYQLQEKYPKYTENWEVLRVPHLIEVLNFVEEYHLALNIELKTSQIRYPGMVKKVLALVSEHAPTAEIIYSSFHYPTLAEVKRRNPAAEVCWLTAFPISGIEAFIQPLGLTGLHLHKNLVLEGAVVLDNLEKAQAVRTWTVNEPAEARKCWALGVEAIITDYPAKMVALREELAQSKTFA